MKNYVVTGALAGALLLGSVSLPSSAQEVVYGRQLMTQQEMLEHRSKMRSFKTEQERQAYRLQHHQRMQVRAREQGMTLPDQPMSRGKGMGYGQGGGAGMGQGMGKSKGG